MVVVLQYNILKIFTTHFNKIHQIYFIFYCSFINEWEKFKFKILRNRIVAPQLFISYFQSKL